MTMHRSAMLLPAVLLAACGGRAERPESPVPIEANWRDMATPADRDRLRGWREAWTAGLDKLRATDRGRIGAEGDLFNPDVARAGAVPPSGLYRCRLFKLGAKGTAMAEFTDYPAVECQVDDEGAVSSFYKKTGTQRPVGTIFHDDPNRAIFLGTLLFGDEVRPMHYGRDARRDIAGYVERIGERRWRLVIPSPAFESLIDVVEIVPIK